MRVRDLTGGSSASAASVLETIDLDAIGSKGYAFQIETTTARSAAGFTVVEVPILFPDRKAGHSKMSRSIVARGNLEASRRYGSALRGRL